MVGALHFSKVRLLIAVTADLGKNLFFHSTKDYLALTKVRTYLHTLRVAQAEIRLRLSHIAKAVAVSGNVSATFQTLRAL